MCSIPGRTMSSKYCPLPRMKRASSLRLTEWPTPRISCAVAISYASLMTVAALCTALTMFW
jgi:hypothetical protein